MYKFENDFPNAHLIMYYIQQLLPISTLMDEIAKIFFQKLKGLSKLT